MDPTVGGPVRPTVSCAISGTSEVHEMQSLQCKRRKIQAALEIQVARELAVIGVYEGSLQFPHASHPCRQEI